MLFYFAHMPNEIFVKITCINIWFLVGSFEIIQFHKHTNDLLTFIEKSNAILFCTHA